MCHESHDWHLPFSAGPLYPQDVSKRNTSFILIWSVPSSFTTAVLKAFAVRLPRLLDRLYSRSINPGDGRTFSAAMCAYSFLSTDYMVTAIGSCTDWPHCSHPMSRMLTTALGWSRPGCSHSMGTMLTTVLDAIPCRKQ